MAKDVAVSSAARGGVELKDWRLDAGVGGLPRLTLECGEVFAELYLNGAHLTAFENRARGLSMFFVEPGALLPGRAIKGGVPLVFPWFGPHTAEKGFPRHGFARNLSWAVAGETRSGEARGIALELVDNDCTKVLWPFAFQARLEVRVESLAVEMRLITINTGKAPFTCENALHAYFAVGDVRAIAVEGVAGGEYINRAGQAERLRQEGAVRFEGQLVDRVFVNAAQDCVIREAGRPAIRIAKSGSRETVVWNPGAPKDKPGAAPPPFVCVEPANCIAHAVARAPGEEHILSARFSFEA